MKKILVPVDFSKPSEYAARIATKIAKKIGAVIYLIHLIEIPSGVVDMGASSKFSIPESMLYLRKTKEKIVAFKEKNFPKDLKIEYFIKINTPFEGIRKCAHKIDADLIVMGSKGHSEFEEIMIGSNTEKVVRTSTVPVIIIKKDDKNFKLKNLVFASNFKKDDKAVFNKFIGFANQFKSKIHLLKINTPSNFESSREATKKIKRFIKRYELPKYSINIYNDTSVEKGILNFSKDNNSDLIALCTHGRSGLSHLFSPSVSKKLSKFAAIPILTIKG
ncbi:MAG: universal stress protein [Polaribacter sp.]|jgi:nucleotide-binding universal stress UspA family protein|nr:universal stress protein [Polaribacter sp.]MDG2151032.1 universal stress protein [Polaribacter sp.]